MPKYKLCYFNGRGRGEISRWIFAVAGQEYEDFRFEGADWPKYKSESPTGQAPWLEVDSIKIGQSTAIARYLARQFGLAGKTDTDQARVDMVVATALDFMNIFVNLHAEKEEEKRAALWKVVEEKTGPEALLRLENLLIQNNGGDGYYVGEEMTWADMYVVLSFVVFEYLDMSKPSVDDYPKLKALVGRVEGHPKIAEWISKRPATTF